MPFEVLLMFTFATELQIENCTQVFTIAFDLPVEMEPPINLTYTLQEAGGDEVGHTALLSWTYPLPSDLQYGWITLQYELQYRRASEQNNWKVSVTGVQNYYAFKFGE